MFCGNCGNELKDDAKFCSKCGQKIAMQNNNAVMQGSIENRKAAKVFIGILVTVLISFVGIIAVILIQKNAIFGKKQSETDSEMITEHNIEGKKNDEMDIVGEENVNKNATIDSDQGKNRTDEKTSIEENELLYQPILDMFCRNISSKWNEVDQTGGDNLEDPDSVSSLWHYSYNDLSLDEAGYAMIDLDQNGVYELLVLPKKVASEDTGLFFDLYSVVDGEISHLASSVERYRFYLTEGNLIYTEGSSSATDASKEIYHVDGKKTELQIDQVLMFRSEEENEASWYYSDDVKYIEHKEDGYEWKEIDNNCLSSISDEECNEIEAKLPKTIPIEIITFDNYHSDNLNQYNNTDSENKTDSLEEQDCVTVNKATSVLLEGNWCSADGSQVFHFGNYSNSNDFADAYYVDFDRDENVYCNIEKIGENQVTIAPIRDNNKSYTFTIRDNQLFADDFSLSRVPNEYITAILGAWNHLDERYYFRDNGKYDELDDDGSSWGYYYVISDSQIVISNMTEDFEVVNYRIEGNQLILNDNFVLEREGEYENSLENTKGLSETLCGRWLEEKLLTKEYRFYENGTYEEYFVTYVNEELIYEDCVETGSYTVVDANTVRLKFNGGFSTDLTYNETKGCLQSVSSVYVKRK